MFQIRETRFANSTRYCREEDGGKSRLLADRNICNMQNKAKNYVWVSTCTLASFLGLNLKI